MAVRALLLVAAWLALAAGAAEPPAIAAAVAAVAPIDWIDWSNGSCRIGRRANVWEAVCDQDDSWDQVPRLPQEWARRLERLTVENQPRLTSWTEADSSWYPALSALVVRNCGLRQVRNEAFDRLSTGGWGVWKLVDLRSNALTSLDWRATIGLTEATLKLDGNPLRCDCSLHWLAVWNAEIVRKRQFVAPDDQRFALSLSNMLRLPKEIPGAQSLECQSPNDDQQQQEQQQESRRLLSLGQWQNRRSEPGGRCALPSVQTQPKLVRVSSRKGGGAEARFNCTIRSTQPLDTEFRQLLQPKVVDPNETRSQMSVVIHRPSDERLLVEVQLVNVSIGQMGWYICVGVSSSGPNFDMTPLVVDSRPQVRLWTRSTSDSVDHVTDTFTFRIYSAAPLTLAWFKNRQPLNFSDGATEHAFKVVTGGHRQAKGFFYAHDVTLMVRLTFAYSFFKGRYSLRACNWMECDELQFCHYDNESWFKQQPTGFGPTVVNGDGDLTLQMRSADSFHVGSLATWTVGVVCVGVGALLCGVFGLLTWCRRNGLTTGDAFRKRVIGGVGGGGGGGGGGGVGGLNADSLPLSSYTPNSVYEPLLAAKVTVLPRTSLEIVKTLGEGAFGRVDLAWCQLSPSTGNQRTMVAVKCLKQFSFERYDEFSREAELMAKFSHPNIVVFYGVCLRGTDELLLLYEYMESGDLKNFLALHGPHSELLDAPAGTWRLNDQQLVSIALQIANGLCYLHEHHFVHRDLAGRNCLVKEPLVVKLSDFGMSRDIYSADYYRLTHTAPLPVRWLPPESLLYGRFSELSDVWSYGVVVWEIVNFGKQPWSEYSNVEVMQRVSAGELLTPPVNCCPVLARIMQDCWQRAPGERAKLTEVIRRLSAADQSSS